MNIRREGWVGRERGLGARLEGFGLEGLWMWRDGGMGGEAKALARVLG